MIIENYENALVGDDFFVLRSDAHILYERIEELNRQGDLLAELIAEAIDQSSETTHDNAPYDAVVHEKYVVNTRLSDLQSVESKMTVIDAPQKPESAAPGTIIKLASEEDDDLELIELAGHWHARYGDENEWPIVNITSPIGKKLAGLAVGSTVNLNDNKQQKIVAIESIAEDTEETAEKAVTTYDNEPRPDKRLIIVTGPRLSGKTTIAEAVAGTDGYELVEIDAVFHEHYSKLETEEAYGEWLSALNRELYIKILNAAVKGEEREDQEQKNSEVLLVGNPRDDLIDTIAEDLGFANSRLIYVNAGRSQLIERNRSIKLAGKKRPKKTEKDSVDAEFIEEIEKERKSLRAIAQKADVKFLNMDEVDIGVQKLIKILES